MDETYDKVEALFPFSPSFTSFDMGSELSTLCCSLERDGGFSGTAGWMPSMLSQCAVFE